MQGGKVRTQCPNFHMHLLAGIFPDVVSRIYKKDKNNIPVAQEMSMTTSLGPFLVFDA